MKNDDPSRPNSFTFYGVTFTILPAASITPPQPKQFFSAPQSAEASSLAVINNKSCRFHLLYHTPSMDAAAVRLLQLM